VELLLSFSDSRGVLGSDAERFIPGVTGGDACDIAREVSCPSRVREGVLALLWSRSSPGPSFLGEEN